MKTRIFGILLVLCFVAPVTTTYVVLQYQKIKVKREVKWRLIAETDKAELVLFKFTEKEQQTQLNWKHSKEFEYKDEMYDVVETSIVGDTTYCWVWWDSEETMLNKKLEKLVAFALGNNPKGQENQKQVHKFLKSLYYSDPDNNELIVFQEIKNKFHFVQGFYQSISISPPVSPPEKS